MKIWLITITVLLGLIGCDIERSKTLKPSVKMTAREQQIVQQMKWLDAIDPLLEAERAIASGKCIFLAGSSRSGVYFPGVEADKTRDIISNNQYKVIEGMGDFIVGSVHKQYRAKAQDHMTQYNTKLLEAC